MTHESSGSSSSEHEEPLSATAMFLRSLEEPGAAPKQEAGWGAGPATPSAPVPQQPANAGPGEFTQMFQMTPRQESAPPVAPMAPVVPAVAVNPGPGASPSGGPGEFTQIFYTGSVSAEAKTVIEPPPYAAAVTPPVSGAVVGSGSGSGRKGFSTPGVSDSASGEGSVTQMFRPVQPGVAQAPAPPPEQPVRAPAVPAAEPVLPNPAYVPESSWKAEPELGGQAKPAGGPSVTQLLSTLGSPGSGVAPARAPEAVPYSPAPVPAYTASPQPVQETASAVEAGSVTQLIQRLAQTPVVSGPPAAPFAPQISPQFSPQAPVAPAGSGPGEFTRMISAAAFAPAAAAPPPIAPPSAQPMSGMPQFPAAPGFAMPQAPQMPHLPGGAPAAPPPQMHMPQVQMPKPPAVPPMPQIAAPKGKLEAMVPVLLIVNTFLLVLVLVVVLFALKGH